MAFFEALEGVSCILFVRTPVVGIDRGWDPADVVALLNAEGYKTKVVTLETVDELQSEIDVNPNALFWPVCYTLSADHRKNLITDVFEERGVNFVGASSASLKFSSKIEFKRALDSVREVSTPNYEILRQTGAKPDEANVGYPLMLKTEFSCNSEGVLKVEDEAGYFEAYEYLSKKYGQTMYVERWERSKEYTAAFIPGVGDLNAVIAPVGMRILSEATFIDVQTKAESPLVEITSLDNNEVDEIQFVVGRVIDALSIDGHCRIDLLRNSSGQLFVIEANFQPFMSIPEQTRSYFPNALHRALGVEFSDQIDHIIRHAMNRRLN